jgi:hypothetical protein
VRCGTPSIVATTSTPRSRGLDLGRHQLEGAAGELFVLPVVAGVEESAEVAGLLISPRNRRIWSQEVAIHRSLVTDRLEY